MIEIEKQEPKDFENYLARNSFKIDGKYPILTMLKITEESDYSTITQFIRYSQSRHILSDDESSVSYGSGIMYH